MATSTNQCTPSARAWQLQLSSNSKKSIVPKTNVTVRPSGEACAARSRADEPGNERVVSIPTQDAASPASTCAGFVRVVDQMWTKCTGNARVCPGSPRCLFTGNDHITYRNTGYVGHMRRDTLLAAHRLFRSDRPRGARKVPSEFSRSAHTSLADSAAGTADVPGGADCWHSTSARRTRRRWRQCTCRL